MLWAFITSDQFHRYSHLSDPHPSEPRPLRGPRGAPRGRIPQSHTCTGCCLCSAPLELPLHRACTAQTSAGSWFTRRGVLASQTRLPVHNTFPAIHNLIYVTIAPINNSVGQLRNYSLKGPELLFLPLPRPICLVSRLRGASWPQVSPASDTLHPSHPLCATSLCHRVRDMWVPPPGHNSATTSSFLPALQLCMDTAFPSSASQHSFTPPAQQDSSCPGEQRVPSPELCH